jgi:DNA-binding response OmpR family regulator
VDDDEELAGELLSSLPPHGFSLEVATDGPRGLAKALRGGFDAIILNSVLPGFDGFSLLEAVRRQSTVPVVMLCPALPEVNDPRRRPDAYLPKPFLGADLAGRLHPLLNAGCAAPVA